MFTERNPHSTLNAATEENNPPDVQTVQRKEKQDKTTNKHPTATTINVITVAEPLNEIITFNNHTTLIPTTILKFDTNKTKVFFPEEEKECKLFTEGNLHSTSNAATEEDNPPDVQTIKTTNKHFTSTATNTITDNYQ